MRHRGEPDDAERVESSASERRFGHREMRIGIRHEDAVDRVVDTAGGAEAEDVPVVDERRAAHGQHEDAWLAGGRDDAERMDMARVPDSRREAPRAAQAKSIAVRNSGAGTRAL